MVKFLRLYHSELRISYLTLVNLNLLDFENSLFSSFLLNAQGIHAGFFVLGENLQSRLLKSRPEGVRKLYAEQCLWSHGYVHKSHQSYKEWKNSLSKTEQLISSVKTNSKIFFRPPYGQRHVELMRYLEQHTSRAILWNMDSQDWHSRMSGDDVLARVQKLMLAWRKGIILFHDIHPKGLKALPALVEAMKRSRLEQIASAISLLQGRVKRACF